MSRVVVHLGPPKTASTFIQRALVANERLLESRGVYLPKAGRLELEPKACCHHHLAWELMGSPRFRPQRGGWQALADEIGRPEHRDQTVVISSEVLGRAVLELGLGDEVDRRIRALGRAVTVGYVVRDQLSAINSNYAQQVKLMEDMPDFDTYATGAVRAGWFDLERHLQRWYQGDEVEFVAIPFSGAERSDPLTAFVRATRLLEDDASLVVEPEPVNITLGPVAVEATRLLRSYLLALNPRMSDDDDAIRRLHRMAAHAAQSAGWTREPFWGWQRDAAAAAAASLADSNARFARAVWGTEWPLELPVDRQTARVDLLDLKIRELDQVHQFVAMMARRYVKLLNAPRLGHAAPERAWQSPSAGT